LDDEFGVFLFFTDEKGFKGAVGVALNTSFFQWCKHEQISTA
jgi:hypothetical protein